MFADLNDVIKEEMEEYDPEEIKQIQERACSRAEEFITKYLELAQLYMTDPEADNETETSAIYTVSFIDKAAEIMYGSATNSDHQTRLRECMQIMFK